MAILTAFSACAPGVRPPGATPLAYQHRNLSAEGNDPSAQPPHDLPHELPAASGLAATVAAIHDGDTIDVDVNGDRVTVRLLGIDTPEKPGGPRPAECFGEQASAFAEQLLPIGTTVLVARDAETRDQYGRLLAWVHRTDGVFVNLALVETGYAEPLFFAPNDQLEPLFVAAGHAARRESLGFWSACGAADVTLDD